MMYRKLQKFVLNYYILLVGQFLENKIDGKTFVLMYIKFHQLHVRVDELEGIPNDFKLIPYEESPWILINSLFSDCDEYDVGSGISGIRHGGEIVSDDVLKKNATIVLTKLKEFF